MNYNSTIYPTPSQMLLDYLSSLEQDTMDNVIIRALIKSRSRKDLDSIRVWITKIILREKGSLLWNEVQRIFRELSFIFSER